MSPAMHAESNDADIQNAAALAHVATITVTYNPDFGVLGQQLSQLPQSALRVLVDNSARPAIRDELQRLAARNDLVLLTNEVNIGLPAALNQGIRHALRALPSCRLLLLLDQDTEPGANGVRRLVARYDCVRALAGKPCCIGPRLIDVGTGLDHGFHQIVGWRWSRRFPKVGDSEPVPVANLNGSGTLLPVEIFHELGGLEEALFIDHVDTEWAFRLLARGYGLYGIPDVCFRHRMGERSFRFWALGWRVWPHRSPQRHYFLFRNAILLMRRNYVPRVWKVWVSIKLCLTAIVHGIFDPQRGAQIRQMIKGIQAGYGAKIGGESTGVS